MRLIDADVMIDILRNSHESHATNSRERMLLYRDIRLVQEQAKYHPVIIPVAELDTTKEFAKWIPCTERLPEKDDTGYVLVNVHISERPFDIILIPTNSVYQMFKLGHINAWMPLPEPYKEGAAE